VSTEFRTFWFVNKIEAVFTNNMIHNRADGTYTQNDNTGLMT